MLDFSKLLTTLAGEIERKPNQKPVGQLLPSETALHEIGQGIDQNRATAQGVADEPSNKAILDTNVGQAQQTDGIQTLGRMTQPVQPNPAARQLVEASQAPPTAPEDLGYYPNGVKRQAMDERAPDGQTMLEASLGAPSMKAPNASPGDPQTTPQNLDDNISAKQLAYQQAMDAPIPKQSFWKDFGAKLVQGADAFFNGNRTPIVGWGQLKHDQAVKRAQEDLNPLIALKKTQQEIEGRQAQNDLTKIRPEIMQREADRKAAKDLVDAKYKELLGKVGQQKADNWKYAQEQLAKYREGRLNISEARLKQYQQVIDETERWHNIQNENADQSNAVRQRAVALAGEKFNWDKQKIEKVQAFQAQMQKDRQQYGAQQAEDRARTALKKAGFPDAEIEQWLHPEKAVDPNDYTLNPDGFVLESNP